MAKNPHAKPNPARIAQEQEQALQLKLQGHSVRSIAQIMGMPPSTVQDRLQAAYDQLVHPVAEEVRRLELERLDRWQLRLEEKLDDGEDPVRVVPTALKVQERRARLLGLDAPERSEVTATVLPAADPAVDQLLSQARELVNGDES